MLPHWLEIVESCAKVAAIGLGGAWAYYKYFRSRTFVTRLELAVSGSIFTHNGTTCCIAAFRLKNVGLSNAGITQQGTGLRASICAGLTAPFSNPVWQAGKVYPTFTAHAYTEPGECIEDRVLIPLPANQAAIRLELQVVSGSQVWKTEEIVKLL